MEPQAAVAARRIAAARKPKPVDILQRPVPKNPKYDYVTSTLDTGVHANNRPEKIDTSHEVFKRIRRAELEQLLELEERALSQSSSATALAPEAQPAATGSAPSPLAAAPPAAPPPLQLEEKKAGEVDAVLDTLRSRSVLLLDVRDEEAFALSHIRGAVNFPAINLRRDRLPREIFLFRGREDKVVVVYDDTGRVGPGAEVATALVEKGVAKALLLSTGLRGFAQAAPHRIEGALPPPPSPSMRSTVSRVSRTSRSSTRMSLSSQRSLPGAAAAAPAIAMPGPKRASAGK